MGEQHTAGGRASGASGWVQRPIRRRSLIAAGGVGMLGATGVLAALERLADQASALELPGSDLAPTDEQVRRTMAAFADTIVPGPAGGADPDPGAVEAGAVRELYEPLYGISDSYPGLHADVQATTKRLIGPTASFSLDQPYADRERVLANRMLSPASGGENPNFAVYMAAGIVVWFCYYGVAQSRLGVEYIDFPPHSDGYAPDHTHGLRFTGMTADGNPA